MRLINVIGLGYIGLPTTLMLAAHGQEVVGTDLSEAVVDNLIYRPDQFDGGGHRKALPQGDVHIRFLIYGG